MTGMFDYKFIIILGLSLIVYFLYKEVETLNTRMTTLEINKLKSSPQLLDLPPPFNIETVSGKTVSGKTVSGKTVSGKELFEKELLEKDLLEKTQPVEEYSNELIASNDNIALFSHDGLDTNTNELAVDSIINMVNDNNLDNIIDDIISASPRHSQYTIDDLLKNKLSILQELANNSNISIFVENTKKKKTKMELANDIISCQK